MLAKRIHLLCAMGALVAIALFCSPLFAQQPGPKMYPGTDFPGNDLVSMPSASPEECASRCVADGRCKAFTFSISERKCSLKWAASRFDGSLNAVSGVVDWRPIIPPGTEGAPTGGYPASPPAVVAPLGPPPTCSAPGNDACSGCSVTCAAGQQASCREGEVHRTSGFSPVCWTKATCECLGSGPPPPSPYTPGPGGGTNPNSCSTSDRFACKGCSASCAPDENPICSPSIPDGNKCHMQAWCRCEKK